MKKMMMLVICGFTGLNLVADDTRQPYVIHRAKGSILAGERPFPPEDEVIIVSNMPTFTVSEPITNSFVFNNGEYIPPPYIVSVSNLTVFLNEIILYDYERMVHSREFYAGRMGGTTPENVARSVNSSAELWVDGLRFGSVYHLIDGQRRISRNIQDGKSAWAVIELARKAAQDDDQAKQELIKEMGLETHHVKLRSDWIERLASNTNLETRATRLLDAKRDRERKEQELRDQQNQ